MGPSDDMATDSASEAKLSSPARGGVVISARNFSLTGPKLLQTFKQKPSFEHAEYLARLLLNYHEI